MGLPQGKWAAARSSHPCSLMSPSVGTSSDLNHHIAPATRVDRTVAACERVSACRDECGAVREADCFERGPIPFADFLYHENRRLTLEHPRAVAASPTATETDASQVSDDTSRGAIEATPASSERVVGASDVGRGETDRGAPARGAIVKNLSRPILVARFIDLYA